MICRKCSTPLNESDIFCPKCGKRQKKINFNLNKKIFASSNIIYGVFFILFAIIVLLIINDKSDKKNRTYDFLISTMIQSITNLNLIASDYYIHGNIYYTYTSSMRKMLNVDTPNYCSYLVQRKNFSVISQRYYQYVDKYQKELSQSDEIFRLYDLYEKTIHLFDLNLSLEKFRKEYEYLYKEYENLYGGYGYNMRQDVELQ